MMYRSETTTMPEFKALAEKGVIPVLPVGSHEEHGAHCSLQTDTLMIEAHAERICKHIGGLLLPALHYGECWNTSAYPGTISLRPETLQALITDIARGVRANGFRGLIIDNGHFGNAAPIEKAVAELNADGFPCVMIFYPDIERVANGILESKPPAPGFYHADELETSIVLALKPEAVQMDKAAPGYPVFPPDYSENPCLLSDFNPSGVFGDPTKATVEKGERLLEALANAAMPQVEAFLNSLK